jgi:tight adherence protein C
MNAVAMMFLGAGVGMGVLLLGQALRPKSQPIHQVFASVAAEGRGFKDLAASTRDRSVSNSFAAVGVSLAIATNDQAQLRKDLAVTDSTLEQHGLVKASSPAIALIGVYVVWLLLAGLGVVVNPALATVVALAGALVAFVLPDVRLRARAKERRAAFRHALSAYLDLVTIIMSGGGGLLTALQTAADSGDGWAFAEIRAALDRARLSNRTPWSQLGVLGDRFDITELRDLVSTAELAGSEGSRVTESVATKAEVLRSRLQAEVEQTSESLTEQMLLPVGLLLVALFLFLGFAVFQQIGADTAPDLGGQALGMLKYPLLRGG